MMNITAPISLKSIDDLGNKATGTDGCWYEIEVLDGERKGETLTFGPYWDTYGPRYFNLLDDPTVTVSALGMLTRGKVLRTRAEQARSVWFK